MNSGGPEQPAQKARERIDSNWMRGTLDLLILKALAWGPRHGYAVALWIDEATEGTLLVEEGTLYPALHRLERQGALESTWGRSSNNRRAKFYRLSARGERRLQRESGTWQRYMAAVSRALARVEPNPA